MFGTIRYETTGSKSSSRSQGDGSAGASLQLRPAQATSGLFPTHTACEPCRTKKLRCSGHKPLCDRCQASNTHCSYSRTAEKRKREHDTRAYRSGSEQRPSSRGQCMTTISQQPVQDEIPGQFSELVAVPSNGMEPSTNPTSNQVLVEEYAQGTTPPIPREVSSTLSVGHPQASFNNGISDQVWSSVDYDSTIVSFPTSYTWDIQNSNRIRLPHPTSDHTATDLYKDPIPDTPSDHTRPYAMPYLHNALSIPTSHLAMEAPNVRYQERLQGQQNTFSFLHHDLQPHVPLGGALPESKHQDTCLQDLAKLLDSISGWVTDVESRPFDTMLGYLKSTLAQCNTALQCQTCILQPEYCMLLAYVIERLIVLSEKAALEQFQEQPSSQHSDPRSGTATPIMDQVSITGPPYSHHFGSYALSSTEHTFLARGLILMHLEACSELLYQMVDISRISMRRSHVEMLQEMEGRLHGTLQALKARVEASSPATTTSGAW